MSIVHIENVWIKFWQYCLVIINNQQIDIDECHMLENTKLVITSM